ncbi:hypothetical protein JCGZ_04941 [Jatropha curcas]|uniref:Uncharacterized protein n=1 Tax=Jatropha curcas TaxID=180498 RepID=A0A067KUI7_JATCU|nr:hypothetical protein JCGZ_04941 [Jatropha curcas]
MLITSWLPSAFCGGRIRMGPIGLKISGGNIRRSSTRTNDVRIKRWATLAVDGHLCRINWTTLAGTKQIKKKRALRQFGVSARLVTQGGKLSTSPQLPGQPVMVSRS